MLVSGAEAEIVKAAETSEDVYARDRVPQRLRTSAPEPLAKQGGAEG